MSRIVLISCVSQKQAFRCKARELYISPLFKKNLQYALRLVPDRIFILSAKYGLVGLDDEIEPYDLTLNNMPARQIRKWAEHVIQQLAQSADLRNDEFVFLAGEKYRRYLVPKLAHVKVPFEGLTIGRQLHQLST